MRLPALALVGLGVLACFNSCGSSDPKKADREEAGAAGDDGSSPAPGGTGGSSDAGAPPGSGDGGTESAAGTDSTGGTDNAGAGMDGSGGDDNPPLIGPVSVDGVIVARNEQPVSNITVEIQGQSVVTGVDGRFQIEAVAPYDIVVRSREEDGGETYIEAYLGVTRADPKLYRRFVDEDRTGGAEGTISGGVGFPQPAGHQTHVTFGGPVTATFGNTLQAGSDGFYNSSGDPTWLNTPTLSGKLFAVQRETATQTVTGIGSAPFTLVDAQTTTGGDVAMLTPALHDFTLNLSAPAGITVNSAAVGGSYFGQMRTMPGAQEVFSLPSGVPDEIGVSVYIVAGDATDGTTSASYVLAGDAAGLDVELLAPPTITGPAQPQVTESTPLSYTRPAGTVATVDFAYETGDAETGYGTYTAVYTNQPSITLKRLSDLDIGMPPGLFLWSVSSSGSAATVDELVDPAEQRWPYGTLSSSPRASLINGTLSPFP